LPKETRQQLVQRLATERDPAVLGPYLRHGSWQVRWVAMESLGKSASPMAEVPLIELLGDDPEPKDVALIHATLGKVGSQAAIDALVRRIHHPNDDVKASAIAALQRLGDASLTPTYLDALSDRSWVAKWYAMSAIAAHGDERALDAVCERLRSSLSRQRKTNIGGATEVMYALEYLNRWRTSNQAAEDTIRWVQSKAMDRLHPAERVWFDTMLDG
jgi:HEAT repeat protein